MSLIKIALFYKHYLSLGHYQVLFQLPSTQDIFYDDYLKALEYTYCLNVFIFNILYNLLHLYQYT